MQPYRLVRAVQRESRNNDVEPLAAFIFHLVAALHDARGCCQRRTAGIVKFITGFQNWLFANHPRPAHFVQFAARIGDFPMAAEQLHRLRPHIFDGDFVSPDEMPVRRRGFVVQIGRFNRYPNMPRRGGVMLFMFHRHGKETSRKNLPALCSLHRYCGCSSMPASEGEQYPNCRRCNC